MAGRPGRETGSPCPLPPWTWLSGPFTAGRAPRTHKKLHTVNLFYLLWEKLSHLMWGLSRMLRKLTDSLAFEAFVVFIVCLNTIMLVAQTFAEVEVRGGKSQGALFTWRRPLMLSQASRGPDQVPGDLYRLSHLILTLGSKRHCPAVE